VSQCSPFVGQRTARLVSRFSVVQVSDKRDKTKEVSSGLAMKQLTNTELSSTT
jgi:hypothetical protein